MATIYDGYDPSSTTWNNSYRLRLLVENTPNAALNQSVVRIRMILYANGSQWFDGWTITENVDYATWNAANVKSAVVAVQNSPSGNQTQGSAGADKTWVDKSYTIAHDVNGQLRMSVHGDFKTNTAPSTTYPYLVPALTEGVAVSSATAPNTTTQTITPYFITNPGIASNTVSRPTASTIRVALNTAAVTNTASNNVITYHYDLYVDNALASSTSTNGSGAQAEGVLYTFPDVSITANASHDVYVKARDATGNAGTSGASSTITSYGSPSVSTVSATEQEMQSRFVDLIWNMPTPNGLNVVTSQTVSWSTSPTFATTLGSKTFASSTQTTYTISPTDSPTSGTSVLSPNTTYYWRVSATNAVGTTTSSISSFYVRPSAPLVSVFDNTYPDTRTIVKVWNGSTMTQANLMVYNGSTWVYLK